MSWWSPPPPTSLACRHVFPPSTDFIMPTFGEYRMFVSTGDAKTLLKYQARWRMLRSADKKVHVAPPSLDLYMPPPGSFSISAQTCFESTPEIARPMLPISPFGDRKSTRLNSSHRT